MTKRLATPVIASTRNPRVIEIRKLATRKWRNRTGLFLVEGIRLVTEAIQSRNKIESLIVVPELLTSKLARELLSSYSTNSIPKLELTAQVMETLSLRDHPQGLAAVVHQRWETLPSIEPDSKLCWVALDTPQDPGNVGAIMRTLDAVGGAGLILLGDATDPYHPVAVRASMGAVCTQRLVRSTFEELVSWQRSHGYHLTGAVAAATMDFDSCIYGMPSVLLMGSERQGLSDSHAVACENLVRIPMVGRVDSLNLAVATSILLYEIFKQQGRGST